MQSYFNLLPRDAQMEILKYYPSYRSLSTSYYNEQQTFYNQYCDEPISKKEFVHYFINNSPEYTVLYGDNKENKACIIVVIKKLKDKYMVHKIKISIMEEDIGEYVVNINQQKRKSDNPLNFISYLYDFYDIIYDMMTMENIVLHRPCEAIKPGYSNMYIKKYFQVPKYTEDITTIDGLYDNIRDLLYLRANIDDYIENIIGYYDDYGFIYDANGDLIDDENVSDYHDLIQPLYEEALFVTKNYLI